MGDGRPYVDQSNSSYIDIMFRQSISINRNEYLTTAERLVASYDALMRNPSR